MADEIGARFVQWDDLVRDGATEWDGVRNPAARLHLKAMQPGDEALFYHSGKEKAAVGVMTIARAWRPDGADGSWASVEVKPGNTLPSPVTLKAMKAEAKLASMEMLRQSRLSVSPVSGAEWATLKKMAKG